MEKKKCRGIWIQIDGWTYNVVTIYVRLGRQKLISFFLLLSPGILLHNIFMVLAFLLLLLLIRFSLFFFLSISFFLSFSLDPAHLHRSERAESYSVQLIYMYSRTA